MTSAGFISTVAGNGTNGFSGDGGNATSASLSYPKGVIVDGQGNFYIADQYNNRVRKVTVSPSVIIKPTSTLNACSGGGVQFDRRSRWF